MDAACLSALAVLRGSVVGDLTSGLTTWMSPTGQPQAITL